MSTPKKQARFTEKDLATVDPDRVSSQVLVMVAQYLGDSFPEKKWVSLSNEVERIIRQAWKAQVSQEAISLREASAHFKRTAVELFGGHCGKCRKYDAMHPCPTLDKKYPGCIEFEKEETHY
jgi:hypothetical protein